MVYRSLLVMAFGFVAACSGSEPGATNGTAGSSGTTTGGTSGVAGTVSAGGSVVSAGGGAVSAGSAGSSVGGNTGGGGAGGGAGGAGATSGGSGGQAGGGGSAGMGTRLTLPVVRGDLDVLELGALSFSVNPAIGARIVSFKLDGDELLTDASANTKFYGSTLWTSPANDWVVPGTFVPPAVVDNQPYATTVSADNVITATSGTYTTPNAKQFVVTKVFHADLAKNAIVMDYQLKNTGTTTFRLSHWEVTRVFTGGLMFFPTGTTTKLDFLKQPVKLTQAGGYSWYDNTTHVVGQGEAKAGSDSPGGFIAQVAPHANGDLLFIKAFKAITIANAPPDHYPIEFYCNDPPTYVELEDHSSYDEIAAGATYTQTVTWYLRRLPQGIDRTPGSAALIAAAQSALGH